MFEILNNFDPNEIDKTVKSRKRFVHILIFIIGTAISALSFNLFFVPNNLVASGLSSLSIIFSYIADINPSLFILVGNLILIVISIITLGYKKSIKSIIGGLLYTLFVYLTQDFGNIINFSFDDILLYVLAAGFVGGFGESLVFKMGYTTGGTSILALILQKYIKKPVGKILRVIGIIIMIAGGFTFGYTKLVYGIIIVAISSIVIDKVMIGISDSKMFFIITKKEKLVKKYLLEKANYGVTELESRGAFSHDKKNVLMCVVTTEKYFAIKEAILEIDENAFIIVSDCYEVEGIPKRKKIPKQNK